MPLHLGHRFVVVAALLWATAGLASWLAPAGVSAATLGVARLLIGGGVLLLVVGARQVGTMLFALPKGALLIACLAMALFQWSFFAAVAGAGVGITAIVSVASGPFFADTVTAARSFRSLSATWCLAALCSAGGILLLTHSDQTTGSGLFLAIASGAAYASYTLAAARLEHACKSAGLAGTAIALLGAGLLLLPVGAAHLDALLTVRGLVVAAYLGIIATALAYWLFIAGLRCMQPATALVVLYVQPLAALLTGMLLLKEKFAWPEFAGTTLITIAALLHLASGSDLQHRSNSSEPARLPQ